MQNIATNIGGSAGCMWYGRISFTNEMIATETKNKGA